MRLKVRKMIARYKELKSEIEEKQKEYIELLASNRSLHISENYNDLLQTDLVESWYKSELISLEKQLKEAMDLIIKYLEFNEV